jgi:hypothetical protein
LFNDIYIKKMKPNNFPLRPSLDGSEELYTQTGDVSEKFTLSDVKNFTTPTLDEVLSIGNSAGANDIDLNNNDLLNVNNINLTTINGSPYSPSSLGGTTYIFVSANGTAIENAAELQTAYTQAATLSSSATNRITILCAPGYYDFESSVFTMSTQYIDLVSLDGNRSIIFNSTNSAGTISITANDVYVKGVDVETKNFTIGNNLNLLKIENCKGGNSSFGGGGTVSGTFTNCEGGVNSFGGGVNASGTFTNCKGDSFSFGGGGIASGTFINCSGGTASFGGAASLSCTASGTFKNCTATSGSFGGGVASGTFIDCIGEEYCFGGAVSGGTASGTFINCIGGDSSFGNNFTGTLTGKLYYCRLTTGSFNTVSGGGRTVYCIDGNNNTNNQ